MILEQILQPILPHLAAFETHLENIQGDTEYSLMCDVLAHISTNRGKRLRPIVMFLIANTLGDIDGRIMDNAATVEILHTASLIHDDVIDESQQRRSQPSVNARWNNKIAVLVGDFLYSKAFIPAIRNEEYNFVKILSHTAGLMIEGELLAIQLSETLEMSEKQYYRLIYAKTASLISAACEISAMVWSDNDVIVDAFREYGRNIGMAFQIKDDIFDYVSSKEIIGKPIGNDIREHKLTLPLIHTLKNATDAQCNAILALIGNENISDSEVKQIIDFAIKGGGIDYAIEQAKYYSDNAIKCLDIIPDSKEKEILAMFSMYMYEREK